MLSCRSLSISSQVKCYISCYKVGHGFFSADMTSRDVDSPLTDLQSVSFSIMDWEMTPRNGSSFIIFLCNFAELPLLKEDCN